MDRLSPSEELDPGTTPPPGVVRVTYLNASEVRFGDRVSKWRVRRPSGSVWESELIPGEKLHVAPADGPVDVSHHIDIQFLSAIRVIGGERFASVRVTWPDGHKKNYDLRPGEYREFSPNRVFAEEE
jgi:hypothetical protein